MDPSSTLDEKTSKKLAWKHGTSTMTALTTKTKEAIIDDHARLQQRVKDKLLDRLRQQSGLSIGVIQEELYEIPKKILCSESKYFRSCFAENKDPYPKTTARLCDSGQQVALTFILFWLKESKRIPASLARAAEEQPEISVKEWCEEHQSISIENWCRIFILAEALRMPRLEEHIRVAVYSKVMDSKVLPPVLAVNYVYEEGKMFCGLKNMFIDMYAIAAMEPKEVFVSDGEIFPEEFVKEVETYSKSEAYIKRREKLKELQRLPGDVMSGETEEEDEVEL